MNEDQMTEAWRNGTYDLTTREESQSINWNSLGAGLTNVLGNVASAYTSIELAKIRAQMPLYQYGTNGVLYREGVPIQGGIAQGGSISPLMLLILVGIAAFALAD